MYRTSALSIAGSDSGGGAGIQADLAAFATFNAFGTTAITAITAQNPRAVTAVQPVRPEVVAAQIDAVFAAFNIGAVKTGMLFSAEIIAAVAARLALHRPGHLVVDPVMVASSGARLVEQDAVATLKQELLPLATVITPNLPETEMLLQRPISSPTEAMDAATELAVRYQCWALVKGGHRSGPTTCDYLTDGKAVLSFSCPRVAAPSTHGTGCSLSAAISACLALGMTPVTAVTQAKAYVLARLQSCSEAGPGTWVMNTPDTLPVEAIEIGRKPCIEESDRPHEYS